MVCAELNRVSRPARKDSLLRLKMVEGLGLDQIFRVQSSIVGAALPKKFAGAYYKSTLLDPLGSSGPYKPLETRPSTLSPNLTPMEF